MTPTQVGTATWATIDTQADTSCGVHTDHTLWCTGANDHGQITFTPGANVNVFTMIDSATDWSDVVVGTYHVCGRKLAGDVWCWGWALYGALGDGLTWRTTFAPVVAPL